MDGICIVKLPGLFGRKQGFQFTMGTWEIMSNYTQLSFDEFTLIDKEQERFGYKKDESRFLILCYYCAAWAYNISHKRRINFDEVRVKKWFDGMNVKSAQTILNAMTDSELSGMSVGQWIKDLADDGEKKKFGHVTSGIMP